MSKTTIFQFMDKYHTKLTIKKRRIINAVARDLYETKTGGKWSEATTHDMVYYLKSAMLDLNYKFSRVTTKERETYYFIGSYADATIKTVFEYLHAESRSIGFDYVDATSEIIISKDKELLNKILKFEIIYNLEVLEFNRSNNINAKIPYLEITSFEGYKAIKGY